ncbi:hypothetical protein [Pseudomonas oryziphila]|uniref:Uncharacterized protein n=1 Tax=Pseudomonas entomophila TaxID=312306 RepID=A0A3Q8U194_9PSED|nr:hypothetical protein [Pseudomonas oryziphila]AZL68809.1 hypothetical protein EJA05_14175 [Pseudomonas oryziphila]
MLFQKTALPGGFFMPAIQALWASGASVVAFYFHTKRPSEAGQMKQLSYEDVWREQLEGFVLSQLPEGQTVTDRDYRDAAYAVFSRYLLFCFCEKFRRQHATRWQEFKGLTPAHLRLIEKHHWLPDQVAALNEDQLVLLLHEELAGLQLPARAHQKLTQDFQYLGIQDLHLNPAE